MEYGLGHLLRHDIDNRSFVLILVLMEYGLGQDFSIGLLCPIYRS